MKKLLEDVSGSAPKDVLLDLSQQNKGVFIGELHLESAKDPDSFRASDIIKEALPNAAKQGLKILFLEHFYTKDQHVLDDYAQMGDRDAVYELCLSNLKEASPNVDWDRIYQNPASQNMLKKQVDRVLDIVDLAQENGVKVFAMDDFSFANELSNRLDVNSNWAQYIRDTTQDNPDSRYWILAGSAHSGGPKGIDTLLQVPSMDIDTSDAIQGRNQIRAVSEMDASTHAPKEADYIFKLGLPHP